MPPVFLKKFSKRSFMLVEIMVSFVLLALCLFPLFRSHTHLLQKRYTSILAYEYSYLAKQELALFQEDLHKRTHQLSPSELKEGKEITITPKENERKLQKHFYIKGLRETSSQKAHLVEVNLVLEEGGREYGPYKRCFLFHEEGSV